MRAQFKATDPNGIDMTLTMTMTIREWKTVRESLQKTGGSYALGTAIRDMVTQAEQTFQPAPQQEKE